MYRVPVVLRRLQPLRFSKSGRWFTSIPASSSTVREALLNMRRRLQSLYHDLEASPDPHVNTKEREILVRGAFRELQKLDLPDKKLAFEILAQQLTTPTGKGQVAQIKEAFAPFMKYHVPLLVQLRADLQSLLRTLTKKRGNASTQAAAASDPNLATLVSFDGALKGLVASWFDPEHLRLERITWDSPAAVLEDISHYEAVHPIRTLSDFKQRLGPGRRVYALMLDGISQPLVFIEVALTNEPSSSIQAILSETPSAEAEISPKCAVFYSINATHTGFAGIELGQLLIKRVAATLPREFPSLETFVTLSPIPGFTKWLVSNLEKDFVGPQERELITRHILHPDPAMRMQLLREEWCKNPQVAEALRPGLMRLCKHYLLEAKRPDGFALDPVTNFHVRNGATVWRLNWLADVSKRGLQKSCGMMVNYLYDGKTIKSNRDDYVQQKKINHCL